MHFCVFSHAKCEIPKLNLGACKIANFEFDQSKNHPSFPSFLTTGKKKVTRALFRATHQADPIEICPMRYLETIFKDIQALRQSHNLAPTSAALHFELFISRSKMVRNQTSKL